ncbi:Rv3235 family protein [Streptomyces sp. NPDC003247]|uniref:Rv3235 family protein n=1 Tax=Streptomyces sp. NPDC003247 TaxID=3364677 RepID=UPI00369C3D34
MNKVMTRAQHTPGARPPGARPAGTRPPGRRDTRRPAGAPPRSPNGSTPRTTPRPESPAAPAPTPHRHLPQPPRPQPRPTDLFADLLVAVLSGQRPVHAMLRHTLGHAYDDLAHLAERGPLRTTHGLRPVVRDIGYEMPRPGAIEAFARISAGDRLRAMAFRLELGTDHRWRCTAVELGGPRNPRPTDD